LFAPRRCPGNRIFTLSLHKVATYGGDCMQMVRGMHRFPAASMPRPDITVGEGQPHGSWRKEERVTIQFTNPYILHRRGPSCEWAREVRGERLFRCEIPVVCGKDANRPKSCSAIRLNGYQNAKCIVVLNVGRISVGRISVGRISVGRISVGRISVGRISVGKISVGKISDDKYPMTNIRGGRPCELIESTTTSLLLWHVEWTADYWIPLGRYYDGG